MNLFSKLDSMFSPQFKALFRRVVLALAVLHLLFQLCYWVPLHWNRDDRNRDLTVYYDAALRLSEDKPLYLPATSRTLTVVPNGFYYPPPFLLLTRPLVEFSFVGFSRAWYFLLLVAFWVYAVSLTVLAYGQFRWRETLVAGLIISIFPGGTIAMSYGNFEPMMWACYGLAAVAAIRYAWVATAALTLGMLMKLHPLWVLGCLLYEKAIRQKQFGLLAVVTTIVILGLGASWWVCGTENMLAWWPSTVPVVSQGTWAPGNVSLSFFGLRVLNAFGLLSASATLPAAAKLYLSFWAIAGPLGALILTRKLDLQLRLAIIAAATILFAPLCWTIYLPSLLIIPAILLRPMLQNQLPVEDKLAMAPT